MFSVIGDFLHYIMISIFTLSRSVFLVDRSYNTLTSLHVLEFGELYRLLTSHVCPPIYTKIRSNSNEILECCTNPLTGLEAVPGTFWKDGVFYRLKGQSFNDSRCTSTNIRLQRRRRGKQYVKNKQHMRLMLYSTSVISYAFSSLCLRIYCFLYVHNALNFFLYKHQWHKSCETQSDTIKMTIRTCKKPKHVTPIHLDSYLIILLFS